MVFCGVYDIDLSSSPFAGCCAPETVLTWIRNFWPVALGVCGLDLKLSPVPQGIRQSLLDVVGEETLACTFLHVSQPLVCCGSLLSQQVPAGAQAAGGLGLTRLWWVIWGSKHRW